MKGLDRIFLASGLALTFSIGAAVSASAAETVYSVEISPSGKHYAVLRDVGDQRAFVIHSADDAAAKPAGVGIGKNEVEDWEWGSDDYILLRISGSVGGVDTVSGVKTLNYSRWLTISRATGQFNTLFGNEQGNDYYYLITSAGALRATAPPGTDHALFAREYAAMKPTGPTRMKEGDDELLYSLIEANLRSGSAKRKSEGDADTIDWIVSETGAPIARIDQFKQSKNVEILAAGENGKGFSGAGSIDGSVVEAENVRFLGRGFAPRTIQVLRNAGDGARIYEYNLDTASYGAAVATPGPVTSAPYDPRTTRTRIAYYASGAGELPFHLDPDDQKSQASLQKALGGATVAIVSKSHDGSRMIVRADYADKPEEFYFYDKPGKRLELIASN